MINTTVLMGRLTADPELKTTSSGVNYSRFSVAVERTYQKAGEERKADFINVVVWQKTAEFVSRYFSKGSMIALEGSIQTGSYTDRDANKRSSFEVVANNVSFCGSKNETGTAGGNSTPRADRGASYSTGGDFEEIDTDDDLPF